MGGGGKKEKKQRRKNQRQRRKVNGEVTGVVEGVKRLTLPSVFQALKTERALRFQKKKMVGEEVKKRKKGVFVERRELQVDRMPRSRNERRRQGGKTRTELGNEGGEEPGYVE